MILAYYAVLLTQGIGVWWVGNWPVILVRYLEGILGGEWAEMLKWPKSIVLNATNEVVATSGLPDADMNGSQN